MVLGNLKQNNANNNTKQNATKTRAASLLPPPVVDVISSSTPSQTSSIGIGEFGMNPARRGSTAVFSMAVKDNLFPKLKFLQGTSACLAQLLWCIG